MPTTNKALWEEASCCALTTQTEIEARIITRESAPHLTVRLIVVCVKAPRSPGAVWTGNLHLTFLSWSQFVLLPPAMVTRQPDQGGDRIYIAVVQSLLRV